MDRETEEKFIMKIDAVFKIPDKGIVIGGGNPEITLEDTSRLCRKGEMIRIKNESRELRLKAEDILLSFSIAGAVIIGILVRESDEASALRIGDRVYRMQDISTTFRIAVNAGREQIQTILKKEFKELFQLPSDGKRFTLKNNHIIVEYNEDFDREMAESGEDAYLYYEHYMDFFPEKEDLSVEEQIAFAKRLILMFGNHGIKAEVISEFEHLMGMDTGTGGTEFMDKETWKTLSLEHAIEIQTALRPKVIPYGKNRAEDFETAAGIDLAYWNRGEEEYAVCCIVVLDGKTRQVIESRYSFGKVEVPYIPGCLAFRELPLILETVKKLQIQPDLYLFDGNGYLHPRRMGIATHASFYLDRPTIGVAKKYYKIGGTDFTMPANENGAYTDILLDGEVCGRALRTHRDVKPVFVSVGNYIDLDTATRVVCRFVNKESHIPLPTRLADLETHRRRRELKER